MFAYCLNNPANYIDSNGLCGLCLANQTTDELSVSIKEDCGGGGSVHGVSIGTITAVGGALVIGSLALAGQDFAANVVRALSNAARDVYTYAHSLMNYSVSRFEDSQPRVHHVIPVGDFSRYGSATQAQMVYMHELLISVDIDINDPENLIVVSQGSHKTMHTKTYISNIYSIMKQAEKGNQLSVRWSLFLARTYASSLDQYAKGY